MLQEDLLKRISSLESALAEAERRAKRAKEEWSDQYDASKKLREEHHLLQDDYESLRLQKGGFGFKALLASGFLSFLFTVLMLWGYFKLKPKPEYVATFAKFQRETLVNYELQLSRGEFDPVLKNLTEQELHPEYQVIIPEIEYLQKIVGAAKRSCSGQK